MIYIFERIPLNTSEPGSIKRCFSKLKLNSELLTTIDEIEHSKKTFYGFFNRVVTDKNFVPKLEDLKSVQEYLHKTIDLLEVGINSSYNIAQEYNPLVSGSQKLSLGKDNVSSLFAEYILSRYVYSLGTIKLLKKKTQHHINTLLKQNNFNSAESDDIRSIFKIGFLRLAKMYRNKNLIWQNLNKEYYDIADFKMGTLDIIYKINEINLSNLYMYHNIMKEGIKNMKSQVRIFLISLAKITMSKISNLHYLIGSFNQYTEIQQLKHFLEAYRLYYYLIINCFVLTENKEIEKRINYGERMEKSLPQLYFENYLLSNKILELERELEEKSNANQDHTFIGIIFEFYHDIIRDKEMLRW